MSCYQYQWKLAFRWLIINLFLLIILIIINVITAVYVIRRGLSDGACAFYLPVLPRYQVLVDTPAVEWSTAVTAVQTGSFLSYLAIECWVIHQLTEGITHYFHNSGAMSCYQYQWKLEFRWLIINLLQLIIVIIINVITAAYVIRRALSDGACAFYLPGYQVLVDTPAVEWSTAVTAVQTGSFWWSMWILPSCPTSLSCAGWYTSRWMIHRCHSCSDGLFLMEHMDSTFLSYLAIECWVIHQLTEGITHYFHNSGAMSCYQYQWKLEFRWLIINLLQLIIVIIINVITAAYVIRRALSDGACAFYLPGYQVLVDTPAVEWSTAVTAVQTGSFWWSM